MNDRKYWFGFNKVRGIGSAKLPALLDPSGDLALAWQAPRAELAEAGLDKPAIESLDVAHTSLDTERLTAAVDAAGYKTPCRDDATCPRRLREINNPLTLLFVCGELIELDDWAVASVGTRSATAAGKRVAEELADALALAGVTLISDFARGMNGWSPYRPWKRAGKHRRCWALVSIRSTPPNSPSWPKDW